MIKICIMLGSVSKRNMVYIKHELFVPALYTIYSPVLSASSAKVHNDQGNDKA